MSKNILDSLAISVFCDNLAMMLSAGITAEEAVGLLCEDAEEGQLFDALTEVHGSMVEGSSLSDAMRGSGYFPRYVSNMLDIGRDSGRTEQTLYALSEYYATRSELRARLKGAIVYPTVLLFIMAAIVMVMVFAVLPVFSGVYKSLTGTITTSTYAYITVANVICWVALVITLVLAVALLIASSSILGSKHDSAFGSFFVRKIPKLRDAARKVSISQFTATLGTLMASGLNPDDAFDKATETIESPVFAADAARCGELMHAGDSMAKAIYSSKLIDPLYARMLLSGARTGTLDEVFSKISGLCAQDAQESIVGIIETLEPVLAGFLTVVVGLSLISIMLPLVGIMGSIG